MRKALFLSAGCFLLVAQAAPAPDTSVPAPVPRDLPGPEPAPGVTPPERIGEPIPRSGVIVPPVAPPIPQADVPAERPGTTPVIRPGEPPPAPGTRSAPGLEMR